MTEEGYEVLELPMPALLTVVKEISFPDYPPCRENNGTKARISTLDSGGYELGEG